MKEGGRAVPARAGLGSIFHSQPIFGLEEGYKNCALLLLEFCWRGRRFFAFFMAAVGKGRLGFADAVLFLFLFSGRPRYDACLFSPLLLLVVGHTSYPCFFSFFCFPFFRMRLLVRSISYPRLFFHAPFSCSCLLEIGFKAGHCSEYERRRRCTGLNVPLSGFLCCCSIAWH